MVKTILVWTFMVTWFTGLVLAMLAVIFIHRAEAAPKAGISPASAQTEVGRYPY